MLWSRTAFHGPRYLGGLTQQALVFAKHRDTDKFGILHRRLFRCRLDQRLRHRDIWGAFVFVLPGHKPAATNTSFSVDAPSIRSMQSLGKRRYSGDTDPEYN